MTINGVEIEVVRKTVKTLSIRVCFPDGRLRVGAPIFCSESQIRDALLKKWDWIVQKREEVRARAQQFPMRYMTGEEHYLFGLKYKLEVYVFDGPKSIQCVDVSEDVIKLYVKRGATAEQRRDVMMAGYKSRLEPLIVELLDKWQAIMGVRLDAYSLRTMKSRWGSCCKSKRRATFNILLAKVPYSCVEYVVVHELAHLIEANHSERFKAILDRHLSNRRALERKLKQFSTIV